MKNKENTTRKKIWGKATKKKNKIGEKWLSFSQVKTKISPRLNFSLILFNPVFFPR